MTSFVPSVDRSASEIRVPPPPPPRNSRLQKTGPIGNGRVTCISIYGGTDLDLGEGPGKILWVDNLGEADGTLEEFLPFFLSEKHKKVRFGLVWFGWSGSVWFGSVYLPVGVLSTSS